MRVPVITRGVMRESDRDYRRECGNAGHVAFVVPTVSPETALDSNIAGHSPAIRQR